MLGTVTKALQEVTAFFVETAASSTHMQLQVTIEVLIADLQAPNGALQHDLAEAFRNEWLSMPIPTKDIIAQITTVTVDNVVYDLSKEQSRG